MVKLTTANRWTFGALALLFIALLFLFGEVLFTDKTFFTPDGSPFYSEGHHAFLRSTFTGQWYPNMVGLAGGARFPHPSRLLELLASPLVYHGLVYALDIALLGLAGLFLLKGQGLTGVAAGAGMIAFSLTGYAFTLISAGHLGVLEMMPYAVFMLGCLVRAVVRRSFFFYALAGTCAAIGVGAQTDIMAMFGLLGAAYGLYLLIRQWPDSGRVRFLASHGLGVVVAGILFIMISTPVRSNITAVMLPARARQIGAAKTPQEQWEFATNWSMPPEEILEFVAPGVFGWQTGDPSGPYWGRVGRAMRWGETRKGMVNLKQHTLYIGGLQILLACFALSWAVLSKVRKTPRRGITSSPENGATTSASADGAVARSSGPRVGEIFFWAGAVAVSLLFALGRYGFVYKVFYMLPYAGKMRCPVKFMHLANVSICVLFAFGIHALLSQLLAAGRTTSVGAASEGRSKGTAAHTQKKKRPTHLLVWACLAMASSCALFVVSLMALSAKDGLAGYWIELGLGASAPTMLSTMVRGLRHGSLLFCMGGAIFLTAWYGIGKRRVSTIVALALLILVPIDMALVGKHYVRAKDVSMFYVDNPLAEHIEREDPLGRLSFFVSARTKFNPLWTNLLLHNVDLLEPSTETSLSDEYKTYYMAFGQDLFRLWTLTNTRFVAGPVSMLGKLANHPAFRVVARFDVRGGRVTQVGQMASQNLLLRFDGCLPKALVYHRWASVTNGAALTKLASPDWDPARAVLVNDEGVKPGNGNGTSPARISSYSHTYVRISVDAVSDGLLLLNDAYHPGWRVTVDGEKTNLLRCNVIMRGVRLPAGAHDVVFTFRPFLRQFLVCLAGYGLIAFWSVLLLVKRLRSRS